MRTVVWRDCPRCSAGGAQKSFDAVYRSHFGCRACGHTELVHQGFSDLIGDGGLPSATGAHKRRQKGKHSGHSLPARSPAPQSVPRFYGRRVA